MDVDAVKPAFILSKVANNQDKVEWKSSAPIKTYSKKSSPINGESNRPNGLCRNVKPFFLSDFVYDVKSDGDEPSDEFTSNDIDIDLKVVKQEDIENLLLTDTTTGQDYVIDMELPRLQETQTIPLPLPLRELKAEPEEDLEQIGTVQDNDYDGFKVGDLAWASISGYPYWPCVITNDPDTKTFTKDRTMGKKASTFYHVTYFGDRGRRNWVSESGLKPYNGIHTFKAMAAQYSTPEMKKKSLKAYKAFTVLASKKRAWNQAVEEAECLRSATKNERLSFFDRYYQKLKRPKPPKKSLPKVISPQSTPGEVMAQSTPSITRVNTPATMGMVDCYTVEGDSVNLTISFEKNELALPDESIVEDCERSIPTPESKSRAKGVKRPLPSASDECESTPTPPKRAKGRPRKIVPVETPDEKEEKECDDLHSPDLPERYSVRLVTRASIENAYPPAASPATASPPDCSPVTPGKTDCVTSATTQSSSATPKDDHPLKQVIADNPHLTPACVKKLLKLWKDKKTVASAEMLPPVSSTPTAPVKSPPFAVPTSKSSIPRVNRTSVLFSEVKHDKICAICFIPGGDLYKCKGPCSLFMHPACWDKPRYQLANAERFLGVVAPPKCSKRKFRRRSNYPRSIAGDLMSVISDDMRSVHDDEFNELTSLSVDVSDDAQYPTPPASIQGEADASKQNGTGCGDVESLNSDTSDKNEPDGLCPIPADRRIWKCKLCTDGAPAPCFICGKTEGDTIRCKVAGCGKDYHEECLSVWPQKNFTISGQTQSFRCPLHSCHVCASDYPQSVTRGGTVSTRLVRCVLCPSTYHYGDYCVTAGSKILSATQIICPLHYKPHKGSLSHQSCTWCAICCEGGSLICCEYCPMVVHVKCIMMKTPEPEKYICDDCESGRFPVYGEIVWAKLGAYRWWPAKVLYPNQIPNSLENSVHAGVGEFPVRFYGTHDHAWINRGRAFHYVDADMVSGMNKEINTKEKSAVVKHSSKYELALFEAAEERNKQNHEKTERDSQTMPSLKPPKFTRISSNKIHSSVVRTSESAKKSTHICECDPTMEQPCGPDSVCINRILMVECDSEACAARNRCQNRRFELKQSPPLEAFLTESRGWGLRTMAPLKKGEFVIEYVGEMIGTKEYQNRLELMKSNRDENYYFLEIDKDRMLDAGPKGNLSRFMNHSCDPNCETQKWTVKGDTRVGLFATKNIPACSELVFNYNLTTVGNAPLECRCGADKCSGFIGGKTVKPVKPPNGLAGPKGKGRRRSKSTKRRRKSTSAISSSAPAKVTVKRHSSVADSVADVASGSGVNSVPLEERADNCSLCFTPSISQKSTIYCADCSRSYHLCCVDLTAKPPNWKCPAHLPKRLKYC